MQLDAHFAINNSNYIRITVPNLPEKDNDIFAPTQVLHPLDIATTTYFEESNEIILYQDVLNDTVYTLYYTIEIVSSKKFHLPNHITPGMVGYFFNELRTDFQNQDTRWLNYYRVWSKRSIQTLLYNMNDTVYLEISPAYPWEHVEPKPDEHYIPFEEFMQSYKPYVLQEIPHETLVQWRDTSYRLLQSLIGEKEIPSRQQILDID